MTTVEDLITSSHRATYDALETYVSNLGRTLGPEGGAKVVLSSATLLLSKQIGAGPTATTLRELAARLLLDEGETIN